MTEGVARLHRFIVTFTKEAITPFYQTKSITKEQFKEVKKIFFVLLLCQITLLSEQEHHRGAV